MGRSTIIQVLSRDYLKCLKEYFINRFGLRKNVFKSWFASSSGPSPSTYWPIFAVLKRGDPLMPLVIYFIFAVLGDPASDGIIRGLNVIWVNIKQRAQRCPKCALLSYICRLRLLALQGSEG